MNRCAIRSGLIVVAAAGAVILLSAFPRHVSAIGPTEGWIQDLDAGIQLGIEQKMPIIVHVVDDIVLPSRKMRQRSFTSRYVTAYLGRFILVEINREEQPAIAKRLGSPAVPLVAFYDPEGHELARDRIDEEVDGLKLSLRIRTVLDSIAEFDAQRKRLQSNPGDYATRMAVGIGYQNRRLHREAIAAYRYIIDAAKKSKDVDPKIRDQAEAGWANALLSLGVQKVRAKEWEEGLAVLEEFLEKFPKSPDALNANFYRVLAWAQLGRGDEIKRTLKRNDELKQLVRRTAHRRLLEKRDEDGSSDDVWAETIIDVLGDM